MSSCRLHTRQSQSQIQKSPAPSVLILLYKVTVYTTKMRFHCLFAVPLARTRLTAMLQRQTGEALASSKG